MKIPYVGSLLGFGLAAASLVPCFAQADSATVNPPQNQTQMQNQNTGGQEAGMAGTDNSLKNDAQAKKTIGPQSVMLQTSLMSAKAQLEGLKSQLSLNESAQPDAMFLNQIKAYDRNIDNTIRAAASHESKMKSTLIRSYPQVASADNTKSLDSSVNDLQSYFKSWSSKANERSYWQDKDQAKADLNSLDQRLDKAIDQSKTFNANQFDISVG